MTDDEIADKFGNDLNFKDAQDIKVETDEDGNPEPVLAEDTPFGDMLIKPVTLGDLEDFDDFLLDEEPRTWPAEDQEKLIEEHCIRPDFDFDNFENELDPQTRDYLVMFISLYSGVIRYSDTTQEEDIKNKMAQDLDLDDQDLNP